MFKKSLLACVVVCLFASPGMLSAQTDVLRWKLKEGQKFEVISNNDATTTMGTPMGEQVIPMKMAMTMSWEVKSAKNGNYEIKQKIERVQLAMTVPGLGDIDYDSDDEDADEGGPVGMMIAQFKQMIGTETTMKFNERGVVAKSDEKKAAAPGNPLGGVSNNDIAGLAFFELPEGEVIKGKSWTQKVENKSAAGSITMDNKYEFVEVDGNGHKISVQGEIGFESGEAAEAEISVEEGKIKGSVWFDNQKGYMTKAIFDQKMEMEMEVAAVGMTMTMSMEGETSFSIKPKK